MTQTKKILMTSGRSYITLDLARQLRAAGHEVYIAETSKYHVCRYSSAVKQSFVVPSPRFKPVEFVDALVKIAVREKIDFVLPICEEIINLSKGLDKFPKECTVFCSPFELLHALHHKWQFNTLLEKLNIKAPKSLLISTKEELEQINFTKPYILKPCYSRGSQKIVKVTPPNRPPALEIEPHNPWIAQEWIDGAKFCTYSICHEGKVKAHAVYPVNFAIDGCSCVIFESVEHPEILAWSKDLVKRLNFSGQLALDFIQDENGVLYAIECNPRATSGAHLFTPECRLDKALFNQTKKMVTPLIGIKRQIAIGMLLYGWRSPPPNKTLQMFLSDLVSAKDVIFKFNDLIPFITAPFLLLRYIALSKRLHIRLPSTFTFDLEWNGEGFLETKKVSAEEKVQHIQ